MNVFSRRTSHSARSILLVMPFCFVACATSGNKRVLKDLAIGGAVGALVAQTKTDHRAAYTAMYAGIGAASAGVISALTSPDPDSLEQENKKLQSQLDDFQKKLEPKLIGQGSSLYTAPLPKEVSGLVEPGEWKRFKIDQWVQDPSNENTWYRQVEMFEVIPPTSR